MTGRDHAHIECNRLRPAHAAHRALLEHTQQFALQRHWQMAYLVEEKRASVGQFEQARLRRLRISECSGFVPEQFTFQQVVWNRRAVHIHKGLSGTWPVVVNRAGKQLFPGSRFTAQQHRHIPMRNHARSARQCRAQCRTRTENTVERVLGPFARRERRPVALFVQSLVTIGDPAAQRFKVVRQREVLLRAGSDRTHGQAMVSR